MTPPKQELIPFTEAGLTVNILRAWPRDKIERFALHLFGDKWQERIAEVERLRTERSNLESDLKHAKWERDEAYKLINPANARIAELEAERSNLQQEYDQEVISHDIEEEDLRKRVAELEKE